jgi:hypothetical protein
MTPVKAKVPFERYLNKSSGDSSWTVKRFLLWLG